MSFSSQEYKILPTTPAAWLKTNGWAYILCGEVREESLIRALVRETGVLNRDSKAALGNWMERIR